MFDAWMSIVGISMGISSIPQIVRIVKRKCSDDVSLALWVLVLHGVFWWLVKGIYEHDISLIITHSFCLVVNSILVWLIVKYRTKNVGGDHERNTVFNRSN